MALIHQAMPGSQVKQFEVVVHLIMQFPCQPPALVFLDSDQLTGERVPGRSE